MRIARLWLATRSDRMGPAAGDRCSACRRRLLLRMENIMHFRPWTSMSPSARALNRITIRMEGWRRWQPSTIATSDGAGTSRFCLRIRRAARQPASRSMHRSLSSPSRSAWPSLKPSRPRETTSSSRFVSRSLRCSSPSRFRSGSGLVTLAGCSLRASSTSSTSWPPCLATPTCSCRCSRTPPAPSGACRGTSASRCRLCAWPVWCGWRDCSDCCASSGWQTP
mmetsp:Transcript_137012/g.438331  ORF Transcript_137012/g.438331 Transcript_137012/m.438331 type:complete len:223 (+) Transcript_137012:788-1456(+)